MKITIDNYQDFKPSELVRSFKDHVEFMIERSKQLKMPINLSEWLDQYDCLGCLGGHATMCMAGFQEPILFAPELSGEQNSILDTIARLGDGLRMGDRGGIIACLSILYPEHERAIGPAIMARGRLWPVHGKIGYGLANYGGAERIIKNIVTVADALEGKGV